MTPRVRNLATGAALTLIALIPSGCCSSDEQLRADVRQWVKGPSPHGSDEWAGEYGALLD